MPLGLMRSKKTSPVPTCTDLPSPARRTAAVRTVGPDGRALLASTAAFVVLFGLMSAGQRYLALRESFDFALTLLALAIAALSSEFVFGRLSGGQPTCGTQRFLLCIFGTLPVYLSYVAILLSAGVWHTDALVFGAFQALLYALISTGFAMFCLAALDSLKGGQ